MERILNVPINAIKLPKEEFDIDRIHSHFYNSPKETGSGKTTSVAFQAMGYIETLENTDIYIIVDSHEIREIYFKLLILVANHMELGHLMVTPDSKFQLRMIDLARGNAIIVCSEFEYNYLNTKSKVGDTLLLFDFFNGVNSCEFDGTLEDLEKVYRKNVTDSIMKTFGNSFINIEINF